MSRCIDVTSVLVFTFVLIQLVFSQLSSNQRTTMISLSELLKSSTWDVGTYPNPCSWSGVSCSPDNSSIIQISLSGFSLSTYDFRPLLCQIDTLQSIDLSNTHLSSIPDEFITDCGKIRGLKGLNFSRNKLVGSLPTFRGFRMLEILDLSHNSLSGNIGLQLDGLVRLQSLNLSNNQFNGPVPVKLGGSSVLKELQLSLNLFQGEIPKEIADYQILTLIDLSENRISGSIPDRFIELSKLEILVLSQNNLSGQIPRFLSNITTLRRFAANQNYFTGMIPAELTGNLRILDLSNNKLNGSIPSDLLSQPNLQFVDLSYNSLEGSVPANMSPNLVRLRLGGNSFTGTIPSSFGALQKLLYLELEENTLTGPIPPELGSCQQLLLLNLAQNKLTSVLPVQLGNLRNLQELKLQLNRLVGAIPIQITQLQSLRKLNVSWNSLSGSIPPSISNLRDLTNLNLQENILSGSIPESIGNLNSLLELQLGKNQLSGKIPRMPQTLQIALNLSSNLFEGSIPATISTLTGLEVLDLSDNRFSGEIPDFLITMTSLTQVLLSNNLLSGVVPKFRDFITVDATGNKDLRNASTLSPPSPKKRKAVAVGVVLGVAVACGLVVGVMAVAYLLVSGCFYGIKGHWITDDSIHKSNIVFSKVIEAVCKPINIMLKTEFSTYYKATMPSGVSYCIKKLNWSNKAFQLLSHEKFGQELSISGSLSNSNIMIPLAYVLTARSAYVVYEYPQNGTLFDLLHGDGSSENVLNWESRYSIIVGVARGLAFLHGCSSSTGPIILLHLSAKTILMKSHSEPLIGDIELCKVINPSKTMGTLSVVAGSVGYIPQEYAYTMRVTTSGNIYSFGVIMLELLTGIPAVSEGTELAKLVLSKSTQHEKWEEILDCRVSGTSSGVHEQMLSMLEIALRCVNASPEQRPDAKKLIGMLLDLAQ